MPKVAKLIEVRRHGVVTELRVDGEPFPWQIGDSMLSIDIDRGSPPSVRLTLLADQVLVDDRPYGVAEAPAT